MTEEATREFDAWMRSPVAPPRSRVDEIVDLWIEHCEAHAHDPAWCAEQDAMYWEGRQGEPYDDETFDEETRDIDQCAYERFVLDSPSQVVHC